MLLLLIAIPILAFDYVGLEIVKIRNFTNHELSQLKDLKSTIPFSVIVESDGTLGIDVHFPTTYIKLPSISASEYRELAESQSIIANRVKEIQEVLIIMVNSLTYECFEPLSVSLQPVLSHCQEIFSVANHTMVSLSIGLGQIRISVEKDIAKVHEMLFNEESGIVTRWQQYVQNDWQEYSSNVFGDYTRLISYLQNAVYTKFVVDFFLIGLFGIWTIMYISRFFPKKPTFQRILDSYGIPAFPLFIVSGIGEIILGICVVTDPSGIKKFFISDALVTLFFVVGVFLVFQFLVITLWIISAIIRIVLKIVKKRRESRIIPIQ